MKIYLASSWRNPFQQNTVGILRARGHEVYDFQHPPGGDHLGFSWSDVDPEWPSWTPDQYIEALDHPVAQAGFDSDFEAMKWAEAGVLLLPCGRSAHLEAGWMSGQGKPVVILLDPAEFGSDLGHHVTELMYKMATAVVSDVEKVLDILGPHEPGAAECVYGCQDPLTCRFSHGGCGHCANVRSRGGILRSDTDREFLRKQADLRAQNNAFIAGVNG